MNVEAITDFETSSNVNSPMEGTQLPVPAAAEPPPASAAPIETPEPVAEPEAEARDPKGRYTRHRARSQQAGPEDVPRIAELTKKLRAVEAELQTMKAPKPAAVVPPPAPPQIRTVPAFSAPKPSIDQFAESDDPYRDHVLALGRWERQKEAVEALQQGQQTQTTAAQQQHQQATQQWMEARNQEFFGRMTSYTTANAGAKEKIAAFAEQHPELPLPMYAAFHLDPRGPELMVLAHDHPNVADELFLLTYGKPVGDPYRDPLVAIVQRRLSALAQAAHVTGSAAAPDVKQPAPRPPNPVRTAPHSPVPALPGDDSSLEDHERTWGRSRRHRR